jgi:hypothetical protein
MGRLENWPVLLYDVIERRSNSQFSWGEFDCCKFAAECVEAMTGVNHISHLQYSTKKAAITIIEESGGIEAMVTAIFGEKQPVAFAQRGDVVLRYDEATGMDSLGICVGENAVFPAPKGIAYIGIDQCLACWKV